MFARLLNYRDSIDVRRAVSKPIDNTPNRKLLIDIEWIRERQVGPGGGTLNVGPGFDLPVICFRKPNGRVNGLFTTLTELRNFVSAVRDRATSNGDTTPVGNWVLSQSMPKSNAAIAKYGSPAPLVEA
ncbi:MAG: hypothetical protein ACI8TQ_000571 [Planctomycetota bacterium]|jgi:hypothetical protein